MWDNLLFIIPKYHISKADCFGFVRFWGKDMLKTSHSKEISSNNEVNGMTKFIVANSLWCSEFIQSLQKFRCNGFCRFVGRSRLSYASISNRIVGRGNVCPLSWRLLDPRHFRNDIARLLVVALIDDAWIGFERCPETFPDLWNFALQRREKNDRSKSLYLSLGNKWRYGSERSKIE